MSELNLRHFKVHLQRIKPTFYTPTMLTFTSQRGVVYVALKDISNGKD